MEQVIQLSKEIKGAFLVLFSAFGFGLMPVFALYAYDAGINVSTLLFLRFSLAGLVFLAYVIYKYGPVRLKARDFANLFFLGGICYTLQSTFYLTAVRYISPSLTALLLYTYPIIVMAVSGWLDRERPTRTTLVSAAVSFFGVLLILGTSYGAINATGILFALSASVVYSVYIIYGNRVIKSTPPLVTSTFVSVFAATGIFILSKFSGGISFSFGATAWLSVLGLAFFSTIVAILCFFRGMELLGPTRSSILSMMEPVFTVIFSLLILKDVLTAAQFAGGAAVLAGAVLTTLASSRT